jgi:uncharacterized protein (DUF1778 family)
MAKISVDFNADNSSWLLIDRAVEISGKSLSSFMFEAAWEKARIVTRAATVESQHVPKDQVSFVLNEADFRSFVTQLEAQPKLNPAVRRLVSATACWEPKVTQK